MQVNDIFYTVIPHSRSILIPRALSSIGCVGDHNSEILTFRCPRVVDGHDLSTCDKVWFDWVNASGTAGTSDGIKRAVDDDYIYVGWIITENITESAGHITFSLHFEDNTDGVTMFRWSTKSTNQLVVLPAENCGLPDKYGGQGTIIEVPTTEDIDLSTLLPEVERRTEAVLNG